MKVCRGRKADEVTEHHWGWVYFNILSLQSYFSWLNPRKIGLAQALRDHLGQPSVQGKIVSEAFL